MYILAIIVPFFNLYLESILITVIDLHNVSFCLVFILIFIYFIFLIVVVVVLFYVMADHIQYGSGSYFHWTTTNSIKIELEKGKKE